MFKNTPLETRKKRVKAMVERMAQAYGVERKNLPQVLSTQKNVINNWGYYGRIPFDQLFHCAETTGVSMDWLLTGKGSSEGISDLDLLTLKDILKRLLNDGVDFNMISEQYPGAIEQLTGKFDKDLYVWSLAIGREEDSEQSKD